jgi:hypothetical protein
MNKKAPLGEREALANKWLAKWRERVGGPPRFGNGVF